MRASSVVLCIATLLVTTCSAGNASDGDADADGDTDGDGDESMVLPECNPDDGPDAAPPPGPLGDGGPDPEPVARIPGSCNELHLAVSPACSGRAEGFLEVDGERSELTLACLGPLSVDDAFAFEEDIYSASYSGFHLSLITVSGCLPSLLISAIDDARYGELPSDFPLSDRLCTEAWMNQGVFNVAVYLTTEEGCFVPLEEPEGVVHIERLSSSRVTGSVEARLVLDSGGDPVQVRAQFDVAPVHGTMEVHNPRFGLCAPPG